ncbi:MAG: Holliday junction branch migration protein RuvA [Treponema sp.]|nr:Holliday junction branch migration protein RuvA [Treponema sp.]
MFNSIHGTITGKFPKQVFIETNGVEWDICMPDSNLDLIGHVGDEAKVFTWLNHTDKVMDLYGFASVEERSLFFDLLKVDGVGPKGAVKIMSSVSSGRLSDVLNRGDLEMLEKIPGVGKKTAGKMMLALKGKLTMNQNETVVRVSSPTPYADLILSLQSMGYDKRQVEGAVARLADEMSKDSDFAGKSQKDREDILFRKVLMELA